ncbi:MAG TPA: helix-hairpin-helix domain-containing protein, partial [Polyangia bacterium]
IALAKERDAGPPPATAANPAAAEDADKEDAPADPVSEVKPADSETKSTAKKAEAIGKHLDRVFLSQAKDAIPIRPNSAEMFVLQRLRDEAHRFAITFHRSQRKKRTLVSVLSLVPGIGPTRQRDLLRHFGSVRKIREASLEDLQAVPGLNPKVASAVHVYFAGRSDATPTPASPVIGPEEADEDAVESAFSDLETEG